MDHGSDFQLPTTTWQTTCPLPPMPDLTTPERYPQAVINGGFQQNPNGMYMQGFVRRGGSFTVSPSHNTSPFHSQCGYYSTVAPRTSMSDPPIKRKPGRPKSQGVNRAKYGTCRSFINEFGGTPTGTKRGRKPGTKNGCGTRKVERSEKGEPIVRTKRKYTRRVKPIYPKEKPITDIIQLTESLVNLLLPPDEHRPKSPELGDLCFEELENLVWPPQEVQGGSDLSQDDVKAFNDLIRELTINYSPEIRPKRLPRCKEFKKDGTRSHVKETERRPDSKQPGSSNKSKPPWTNVLNCRRKAMRKCRRSMIHDDNTSKSPPSTDTWNCKIGGKCGNKWQLLQKHVLENNVVKQLREERQTERLIKVLCSTPQRTLRSRVQEDDDSLLDVSTTSTETASPEKSNSSWMTLNDASLNTTGQDFDLSLEKSNHVEAPTGFFTVEGGVCPDIEPTLCRQTSSSDGVFHSGQNDYICPSSYPMSFLPLQQNYKAIGY